MEAGFIKPLSNEWYEYIYDISPSFRSEISFLLGSKNNSSNVSMGLYARYQDIDYQFKRFADNQSIQGNEQLIELGVPLSSWVTLVKGSKNDIHTGLDILLGGIYGLNAKQFAFAIRPRLFSTFWFKKSSNIQHGIRLELGLDYIFGSKIGNNPVIGIGYNYVLQ